VSLSRAAALAGAQARLRAAGLEAEDARADARILLAALLGLSQGRLAGALDTPLEPDAAAAFDAMLERREQREPVSQILGNQPFWTLDLAVSRGVLTPRPDTETLVEAALAHVAGRRSEPLRVLDLGTGSGAILLSLLSELPAASGLGVDASESALGIAGANARACGLDARSAFQHGDWTRGVDGRFDLIVSNPPYIASGVLETLSPEVRDHEPRLALDGGADGLDAYRRLFAEIRSLLAPGGGAFFEIGHDQGPAACALARAAGWREPVLHRDLAGRDRVVALLSVEDSPAP